MQRTQLLRIRFFGPFVMFFEPLQPDIKHKNTFLLEIFLNQLFKQETFQTNNFS